MNRLRLARQLAPPVAIVANAGTALLDAVDFLVRGTVDTVYANQYEEIEAIGRLRVAQVTTWWAGRLADVEATAGSPFFAAAIAGWEVDSGNEALRGAIEDELRRWNTLALGREPRYDVNPMGAGEADHG